MKTRTIVMTALLIGFNAACSSQNSDSTLNVVDTKSPKRSEEEINRLELQKRNALIALLEQSRIPKAELEDKSARKESDIFSGKSVEASSSELLAALKDQSLSTLITFEFAKLNIKEDASIEEYNQAAAKQRRNVIRITLMPKQRSSTEEIPLKSFTVEFETDIKDLSSASEISQNKINAIKRLEDQVSVPV